MAVVILYYYFPPDYNYGNMRRKELNEVCKFIKSLKGDISALTLGSESNFLKQLEDVVDASNGTQYSSLFVMAFNETFSEFDNFIEDLNRKIEVNSNDLYNQCEDVGFTGGSLRLKLSLISDWWKRLEQTKINGLFDWANDAFKRVLKKFLNYLNSLLGSLAKIFPIAEVIKELKEIIESALYLFDEVRRG